MTFRPTASLAAFIMLAGCAGQPTTPTTKAPQPTASTATHAIETPEANDNLNAVVWTQLAVEHDLIYLQTYRNAQAQLLTALKDPHWDALPASDRRAPLRGLKPAVVLDIDETVLDNSPYQARLVRQGTAYNEADWAAWCRERNARALPGAVAFTQFAAQHGVAVIYLSNRAKDLDQATLDNLRKVSLPVMGSDALISLGTNVPGCPQIGTAKDCRRRLISQKYRVLMQFGDQLGDFIDASVRDSGSRGVALEPYRDWIGQRWFVLPNPSYGAWETALHGGRGKASASEWRSLKLQALRLQ